MAWRSCNMAARLAPLAALFAALCAPGYARTVVTQDPVLFEAAFQGRCGEGSPCEQLCRELHDGTFECGCSAGYVLHVDGYGCLELNATKSSDSTPVQGEDVLYQKDVSFSAELEIVPSNTNKLSKKINISERQQKHINDDTRLRNKYTSKEPISKQTSRTKGERKKEIDGLTDLIENGLSDEDLNVIADDKEVEDGILAEASEKFRVTTQGPSLEQKVPGATDLPPWTAPVDHCDCSSCKPSPKCSCPLSSTSCKPDRTVSTPRFSGNSWLALSALRGAYKRVRLRIRVRPERARGVLLLTGEHDDLSGDYLALMLKNGFVELRYDCGSGAGVLRSPEPVRLGHWNTISVYRHRWDAWLRLNSGKRVRGRSKGLFSRMTFREPVWVGGAGNTSGLQTKLGLSDGLLGCVDFLRINGDTYKLMRDAVATSDIGECAPTLAPWRTIIEATSEIAPHSDPKHGPYDINDIVHFEDNDLVMRDPELKEKHDIENSINQFKFLGSTKVEHSIRKKIINAIDDNNIDAEYLLKDEDNVKMLRNDDSDSKLTKNDENLSRFDEKSSKNDSSDDKLKKNDMNDKLTKNDENCDCQHGGGCVNKSCLCPLGYAGDKCEITLDLKVPRFNGSSYLRLPGLGDSAQNWLDIQITVKPTNGDGLLLYNADEPTGDGDFFSLHLREYFVEFAFDLGSGIALVRSAYQLTQNEWHSIRVKRAGRRATLYVNNQQLPVNNQQQVVKRQQQVAKQQQQQFDVNPTTDALRSVTSRGTARKLSLRQPMLLGGAPEPLPDRLALKSSFSGCVGQMIINDEEISVVSAALGGVNVHNCDELDSDSCRDQNLCKETLNPTPIYNDNLQPNAPHYSIVPKKGNNLSSKHHKTPKKHIQKRRKPYKMYERSNEIMTNPVYDGKTYMQVKYLNENDMGWVDMNMYPRFSGKDSFIHIDDEETSKRLVSYTLDINLRFRSLSGWGLVVWSGGAGVGGGGGGAAPGDGDFLSIGLEDSILVFRYNLGSGEVVITANHTKVDDGLWHRARATRNRQAGVLEVDGLGSVGNISPGKLKQLNTQNGLYIGGLPAIEINTQGRYKTGLIGCVSQISLSGDYEIPLSLSKLPHTITNNVGTCAP